MQVKKKLLDLVRDKIRFKHYSYSTERTYVHWIRHYIFFHQKKHPIELVTNLHKQDLDNGYGSVFMPYALEKKYPKSKYETK